MELPVLVERVNQIERRFVDHERRQNSSMEDIDEKLEVIRSMVDGRPSWAVTLVLTVLCSLVTALSVALLSGG